MSEPPNPEDDEVQLNPKLLRKYLAVIVEYAPWVVIIILSLSLYGSMEDYNHCARTYNNLVNEVKSKCFYYEPPTPIQPILPFYNATEKINNHT